MDMMEMVVLNVVFTTDYKSIPCKDDLLYNPDALPIIPDKQMFRCSETFIIEWVLYKSQRSFSGAESSSSKSAALAAWMPFPHRLIIAIPR